MSAFTPAQSAAIAARGNVLVIAGAGTGKTRTLVERCLQLLREGASLDRMLLVTFTEAAAAEMRARLRRALQEEVESASGKNAPSSLTPALSRREREQARPPSLLSNASSSSPARAASPPLPAGEGRGEGENIPSSEPARSRPETPDPRPQTLDHFSEQLALLDAAQISTLHGFCLRLVREHFHALAIDPQLVILDERQTRPLARDCLTALLDEHYAGRHPHSEAVQQLIRRAGRGADEHLRVLVGRLHRYAQSLPDPDAWLAGQLAMFREESPSQWHAWLLAGFEEWRAEWLAAFVSAPDVTALKRARAALSALSPDLVGRAVLSAPPNHPNAQPARWGQTRPTTEALVAALAEVLAADGDWPRGTKTKLRPPFSKLFEEAEFFHSLLAPASPPQTQDAIPHPPSPLAEDWAWSRHAMAALVELTRQFTTRFGEAKRQLGGLDFADLEQFALRLLRDDSTGVARHCRDHFRHVCVDEYQDINAVQDAILRAVSGDGAAANRFLVGDLKQSIYRFRLANPRIFAGYATAWRGPAGRDSVEPHSEQSAASMSDSAKPSQETRFARASSVGKWGSTESRPAGAGGVIALSDNFRSHEAVLDFVNPLFRALMREAIGGVAYDAEAELRFGNSEGRAALRNPPPPAPTEGQGRIGGRESNNPPQPDSTARVELHILTKNADEPAADGDATNDLLDLLAIEREARCVALRLGELRASGHRVWDDDEAVKAFRPVEWRDMVVLMRSPGSRAESFAQEFHRAGVPLHAERGGFYEALEVSDLLNLLRLLDNPLQDLPLLAVLRSPLVAMSLEELVAIRAHNDERLFWDALVKGARTPTSAGVTTDPEPAADVGVRAPEPPAAPPFILHP
ncbi:MAG: UvrD-helicase domain-containing protein, partial [Limisphaerales bacterium]